VPQIEEMVGIPLLAIGFASTVLVCMSCTVLVVACNIECISGCTIFCSLGFGCFSFCVSCILLSLYWSITAYLKPHVNATEEYQNLHWINDCTDLQSQIDLIEVSDTV
jgi:hypothetical protein